ncbi:unnamed protein product [Closterium sp. Naga37s-1]|nr:unnamed protein product [Closterium sp. Naga37s-1]
MCSSSMRRGGGTGGAGEKVCVEEGKEAGRGGFGGGKRECWGRNGRDREGRRKEVRSGAVAREQDAAAGNLQVAQSDHNAGDLDLSPDGGPVVDDSGDAGVPLVRSPAVTNPRDDPTSPRVHWTATEMLQLVQARVDLDPDWDLMRGVQGANYWAALHTLVLERHPRFRFSRGAIKIKMLRIEAQYKQLRDRLSRSGAGAIRYFPSWYGLMETIRGNRPGVQPVHRVTAAMITTPTPLPVPTPTAVTHVGPIRARPAVLASTTTTIPSVDATIRAATTGGSGRNTRTPSTDVNSPVTPSGPVSRTPTPRTPTTAVVTPVTTTNQPTAPPSGTGSPSTPSPSVPTASPSTSAGGTGTPPAGGSPTQSNGRSTAGLIGVGPETAIATVMAESIASAINSAVDRACDRFESLTRSLVGSWPGESEPRMNGGHGPTDHDGELE